MPEKKVRIGPGIRIRPKKVAAQLDAALRLGNSKKAESSSNFNQAKEPTGSSSGPNEVKGNQLVESFDAPDDFNANANIGPSLEGGRPRTVASTSSLASIIPSDDEFNELPGSALGAEQLVKQDFDGTEQDVTVIENIESASGNYMLTLGYPGSGKTVLQSFIYYYIATHGDFFGSIEREREGGDPKHLTQTLLNEWVKNWSEKKFPAANRESEDAIREVRLQLSPKINKYKSFNFSFVEVSGELIRTIVPNELRPGTIKDTLHRFLTSPRSRKIIVYVFDHNEASNNDELFASLIQYLDGAVAAKLDKHYSLMIVVPNPDLVRKKIANDERWGNKDESEVEISPNDIMKYLKLNAPQLVATFRHWDRSKRGVFKFHIGDVSKRSDGQQFIEKFDFADSRRIIEFCYKQFNGRKLEEGWFKKLMKALRN